MIRVMDGFRFALGSALFGVAVIAAIYGAVKTINKIDPDLIWSIVG